MTEQEKAFALTRPVHADRVHLAVADLPLVSGFYRNVIGLDSLEKNAGSEVLGIGGRALVMLSTDGGVRPAPKTAAGLYHTAFLVPDRQALAHWLAHAAESRIRIEGASDHMVSEALYLSDPEGNGIEIYRDRRPEEWTIHDDGTVEMATLRLDLQALYADAPQRAWTGMAAGTAIGHVHLQVGDIAQAEGFYRDVLGLKLMTRYPGASFFASGGYHHHIGANIWHSRGAGAREPGITGLSDYTLRFNDAAALDDVLARLAAREIAVVKTDSGWSLADPWGIGIRLEAGA